MRSSSPGLILSLLLISCSESPAPLSSSDAEVVIPEADRQRITSEIDSAMNGWLTSASELDEAESFAVFSDSPSALTAFEGEVVTVADFRASWSEATAPFSRQIFANVTGRVDVIRPDLAIATRSGEWAVVDEAGQQSASEPWALTAVWIREGDEWRVIQAHQSVAGVVPPPMSAP